jgi:Cd2+/Zn2+-exporting ATPase
MAESRTSGAVLAPGGADTEVRRFRVVSGCVECAGDLTPLRRVPGVRDVRMLSATGTLVVEMASGLEDAALLKTANASGLVLEPAAAVQEVRGERRPRTSGRWWLRPELIFLAISAALLVVVEILGCYDSTDSAAKAFAYACVAFGIVYPARTAFLLLRTRRVSINLLLVAAVAGAIPLGKVTEAACVVVIFSLGVVLESFVADRARRSIQKLMELAPVEAERFSSDGAIELVPVEKLEVGDLVLVRPGTRLPTDGTVWQGSSWIDAAAITGESMPVEVEPGAAVYGGTLNGHAALQVEVGKPFQDTVLARVIREVEEAQQNRGVAQRFADRFSSVYTPLMIVVAAAMVAFGPMLFHIAAKDALYRALVVLVVSCSCSLVLSVPVSVVSAVARAARDGVLIKGGAYLEELARLQGIAFDKTGTLTSGRPSLVQVHPLDGMTEQGLLRLSAAVEAGATHPIAEAIVRAAHDREIAVRPAPDVEIVPGIGAHGTVDGSLVSVGRVGEVSGAALAALTAVEAAGATPVSITVDGRLVGLLGVADSLRPDALLAIEGLRSLGITHTTMLTGDREQVAKAIAGLLGIENVRAELLPDQKRAAVAALKEKVGTIAMVGDGVNDAPALATADVAIVMGAAGTDVALETADVALMADDLTKLPYAVALARRSRRIIAQNVGMSLAVILLLVVAAVTGSFSLTQGVLINEAWALVIIGNGLRLLRAHKSLQVVAPRPVPAEASSAVTDSCGDDCGCGTPVAVAAPVAAVDSCGDSCGCGTSSEPAERKSLTIQPLTLTPAPSSCAVDGSCGCSPAATASEPGRMSSV